MKFHRTLFIIRHTFKRKIIDPQVDSLDSVSREKYSFRVIPREAPFSSVESEKLLYHSFFATFFVSVETKTPRTNLIGL